MLIYSGACCVVINAEKCNWIVWLCHISHWLPLMCPDIFPIHLSCQQNVDGVNYFHVKVAGLLFVATTRVNVSPSLVLELLQRIARVIKDYLGILNEDSLRKNFVLVYELLDEVIVSMLLYLFPAIPSLEWLFKN